MPGVYPRTQFRTGSESGLSHQPLQHSLHLGRGPRALAPRSRDILGVEPGCDLSLMTQCRPPAAPLIGGAISAALADARCWRAAADCMRIFTVGLTPRLPPSFVPRALAAATAAFVRALILSLSSSAARAMMPTVSRLAFGMSAATKSTPTSAPQPWLSVAGWK